MASGGEELGKPDYALMLKALRSEGTYVVLTHEEYDMLKQPTTSTPKMTLAEKLSASLPSVKPQPRFHIPGSNATIGVAAHGTQHLSPGQLGTHSHSPTHASPRFQFPSTDMGMQGRMRPAHTPIHAHATTPHSNLNVTSMPATQLHSIKIPQFSGDEPAQKGDVTYEVWRFEVRCLMQDSQVIEPVLLQAIRKSLRGTARQMLIPLGESASSSQILEKLDGLFGNVSSNEAVMQRFYTTVQGDNESVTAFGCRLESILQLAIDNGHMSLHAKNDMLRSKFWTSLKNERLKNQTRHKYDSLKSFDALLREIRVVDLELTAADSLAHTPNPAKQKHAQHHTVQLDAPDQSTKIDKMSEQMTQLMEKLKTMEKKIESYENNHCSSSPDNRSSTASSDTRGRGRDYYRGAPGTRGYRGRGRGYYGGSGRGMSQGNRDGQSRTEQGPKDQPLLL